MEITMETPIDVGGFQMDVTGTDLGAASGGLAADAGFIVSTGGTTMLGFSFSGGFIPAGSSGVLTNVEYTATASEACIINPVISDINAGSVTHLLVTVLRLIISVLMMMLMVYVMI